MDWSAAVDGLGRVRWDPYTNPETLKDYHNYHFECPYHEDCIKTRGIGPRNTKPLGPLQPLAFLHAWRDVLEDVEDADPRCHNGTPPTMEQVTDFYHRHREGLNALALSLGAPTE